MNLGAFVRYAFPEEDLDQLAFAPFPKIDAEGIGRFEEFSLNSIHIPANAKNKQGAREFLAYFYQPENLGAYLEPGGNVPPRNDLPPSKDPLVNVAVESAEDGHRARRNITTATAIPTWRRRVSSASRNSWQSPSGATPSWSASRARASASTRSKSPPGDRAGGGQHAPPPARSSRQ